MNSPASRRALTVEDVFITAELDRRPQPAADHFREKLALQDLAARMLDGPEEVLPRFVELAMQMTGGTSAGLSLFEQDPAPGIFRWRYLRGILARFENATTPRESSPCGVTLDCNAPVLSLHPERVYGWISDAGIVVPEVLLVPLYLGGAEPLGTLWIVSDSEGHFHRGHARIATELATFVGIALRLSRTEQEMQAALADREAALEAQSLLTNEMSHRVNNVFAMTDAMIYMSAKTATSVSEMADTLSGRLEALARANSLVRRNFLADRAVGASDLAELVGLLLAPHDGAAGTPPRFSASGPAIACGPHMMNGIALVLHELATNAVKYGAFSTAEGRVDIRWRQDGDDLALSWCESDGPRVEVPSDGQGGESQGFGSRLVTNTVRRQLGGTIDHDWRPEGLRVAVRVPMASLAS